MGGEEGGRGGKEGAVRESRVTSSRTSQSQQPLHQRAPASWRPEQQAGQDAGQGSWAHPTGSAWILHSVPSITAASHAGSGLHGAAELRLPTGTHPRHGRWRRPIYTTFPPPASYAQALTSDEALAAEPLGDRLGRPPAGRGRAGGTQTLEAAPSHCAMQGTGGHSAADCPAPSLPAADFGEQRVHTPKLVGGHHVCVQRL